MLSLGNFMSVAKQKSSLRLHGIYQSKNNHIKKVTHYGMAVCMAMKLSGGNRCLTFLIEVPKLSRKNVQKKNR